MKGLGCTSQGPTRETEPLSYRYAKRFMPNDRRVDTGTSEIQGGSRWWRLQLCPQGCSIDGMKFAQIMENNLLTRVN